MMTPKSSTPQLLPPNYLHQTEIRSQKQIILTDQLARLLTQQNLKRISQKSQQSANTTTLPQKSPFFFVCISGIPPFDNQFRNLNLPGQIANVSLSGLKGQFSEKQYIQIFRRGGFVEQAHKIRSIIQSQSKKGFKIVIFYHSFGSFSFMQYLDLFKNDHKISGIIDIGGAPIRYYPLLGSFISQIKQSSLDFLQQNADLIYESHLNDPMLKKAGFIPFQNKYQTIIHYRLGFQKIFQTAFQYMRNMPKVLKLFLYGRKDRIFPQSLINQKVIYYSYVDKFNEVYDQKLRQSFKKYYGQSVSNVQQKFIFDIQGGQHSLHMQQKYNQPLSSAIHQYLQILSLSLEQ